LKKLIYTLITVISISLSQIIGQEIPPLKNYTPNSYKGGNQNWKLSQNNSKHIYSANNEGLLEFRGAKWKLYPSPNNTILRSVTTIGDLVYTGAHMEFGVWKRSVYGDLTYTSISNQLKVPLVEDEDIWNIIEYDKWVLFQSLHRIYIYNTEDTSFKIIKSETVLQKIFKINKSIFFQKTNDGLYKIENGEEIAISKDLVLKKNILVNIYSDKEGLLLLTQEKGFFHLSKNGTLNKWKTKNESLLEEISVYSSCKMFDGSYILGTISNGIYILNKDGAIVSNINQKKGLNNNTVLDVFEDRDHNIWLALDNGISVLNYNDVYKVYSDINTNFGAVYTATIFEDYLYLGTNQGLFYKKSNSSSPFQLIQGTKGQVWCLSIIDNEIFCGHNKGAYLIKKNKAIKITDTPGTWEIKKIPTNKNLLLQGNYNGLYVLHRTNGKWQLRNKIEGFDNSSRFFEIYTNNEIFVNHEYKGIFRLQTNEDFTKITNVNIDISKKGNKSGLTKYKGEIIYGYNEGIYIYDSIQKNFVKSIFSDEVFTPLEKYISGKIIHTTNDKLWGFTQNNIVYFSSDKINNTPKITKIALPSDIRRDISGYENVTHIKDETYLIGNAHGYILLDLDKIDTKAHTLQLQQITKGSLNGSKSKVPLNTVSTIPYIENNIDIRYTVPNYDRFTEVKYQHKLIGLYDEWSTWTLNPRTAFKNLPFGDYTFIVRAKTGNTISSNEVRYSFSIDRPWYLSNQMIGTYICILILLFFSIHTVYKQYYKRQKQKLLYKKQREFERSQLEKEKEIMKLRNDKLRSDIENKNRELAASTMSIIKKNEFLNTIKKELQDTKGTNAVNPVIKIIDKNLNNHSDWELFQEAFNNADKDFLKKVKDKHPNLTPNDLRLCAYLRLNLSSKEIAPLLNISYKSVEIKRYRLRKKMGLTTKDNLTHHILEI